MHRFFGAIRQDPVLATRKLIVEPWCCDADGTRLGRFPSGYSEWNNRFQETIRRFWRGDEGQIAGLAFRLSGSNELFGKPARGTSASINYVACHDGFTLEDVVSYERKRNEANGWLNADGPNDNQSCNWGEEGPTTCEGVRGLRRRVKRNLLATLAFSQGVPMILAGDELGRTQRETATPTVKTTSRHGSSGGSIRERRISSHSPNGFFDFAGRTRSSAGAASSTGTRSARWSKGRYLAATGRQRDGGADWYHADRRVLGMLLEARASDELDESGRRVDGIAGLLIFNAARRTAPSVCPNWWVTVGGRSSWTPHGMTRKVRLATGRRRCCRELQPLWRVPCSSCIGIPARRRRREMASRASASSLMQGIDGAELERLRRGDIPILTVSSAFIHLSSTGKTPASFGRGIRMRGRWRLYQPRASGWSWSPSGGTACSRDCLRIAGRPCRTNCGSSTPTGRSTLGTIRTDSRRRSASLIFTCSMRARIGRLWNCLGARARTLEGVDGVSFAVWAPNALRVSIVGDFCRWDGRRLPMRQLGSSGVFELFVPGVRAGDAYKYEIKTRGGDLRLKSDPMATFSERPPGTASRVFASRYAWGDGDWMRSRASGELRASPLAVYEVHLGSWARVPEENNRPLTYREIAPRLAAHVRDLNFTHVQLLPIAEHPFDGSWGYQITGYYAPTARFGDPDDFRYFVDCLHQQGIGVLLDWVPAHFPKDDFALRRFDGTALYEHEDPPRRASRLGHADLQLRAQGNPKLPDRQRGLLAARVSRRRTPCRRRRLDAVPGLQPARGEWLPNEFGGKEDIDAIELLRTVNTVAAAEAPAAPMIAEESTSWSGVTKPTSEGGLGFQLKWNMGWMHDTLSYFSQDPVHRKYHHDRLTFAMLYEHTEAFIMPLSHDEVVHGKRSLLEKMPGDLWQRFANLRLLLTYQYLRPGGKLLFMGTELAPYREWDFAGSLDWHLADEAPRAGVCERC